MTQPVSVNGTELGLYAPFSIAGNIPAGQVVSGLNSITAPFAIELACAGHGQGMAPRHLAQEA
jgi:hypothetical protein